MVPKQAVFLIVAQTAVVTFGAWSIYGTSDMKEITKATVEFDTFDENGDLLTWSFRIDDPESIERTVGGPLRDAAVDKSMRDWQHMGQIRLVYVGGQEEVVRMYSPLGQIKRNDVYYTADFAAIARRLRRFASYADKRLKEMKEGPNDVAEEP